MVAASSYEARAFGVRSAMSMARAIRLCPHLAVVPPDFAKYRAVSADVFGLFRAVTPLVEPLSLDEAYLDVTENAWDEPLAVNVARRLKAQIRATTGLTASAGVAPNKFLAKIALGVEEARRAHRRGARARGVVPAAAARRRALGRGPGDGRPPAEHPSRTPRRRAPGRSRAAAPHRRQSRGMAARPRPRHRQPARRTVPAPQVGRHREHLRPGHRGQGAHRRGARPRWPWRTPSGSHARACSRRRSRSRSATGTSRPSREATRSCRRRGTPPAWRGGPWRCSIGPRPARARCGCSASACTAWSTMPQPPAQKPGSRRRRPPVRRPG